MPSYDYAKNRATEDTYEDDQTDCDRVHDSLTSFLSANASREVRRCIGGVGPFVDVGAALQFGER